MPLFVLGLILKMNNDSHLTNTLLQYAPSFGVMMAAAVLSMGLLLPARGGLLGGEAHAGGVGPAGVPASAEPEAVLADARAARLARHLAPRGLRGGSWRAPRRREQVHLARGLPQLHPERASPTVAPLSVRVADPLKLEVNRERRLLREVR